ncbi:flagellar protein FlgN [Sporosarcina sp. FSL W8-0480]|uniref:flagellar protein FlgN n=1 Tax=Sporosarcina sp. FSL W8-0480 TaxID=2954701 RepID=UPI0030D88AAD
MTTDTILSILDNLEKLHKSLLRIANEKSELIKNGDIKGIDQLLIDEQAHLAAIVQMDQSRQKAVSTYLEGKGIAAPMNPTITDLIEATPVPESEQLTEARDRLLHAIHELKWQNDLNQKLTYQSLQFVNLSLDMVRPRTESVTYSKSGINGKKATGTGTIATFDSQA